MIVKFDSRYHKSLLLVSICRTEVKDGIQWCEMWPRLQVPDEKSVFCHFFKNSSIFIEQLEQVWYNMNDN